MSTTGKSTTSAQLMQKMDQLMQKIEDNASSSNFANSEIIKKLDEIILKLANQGSRSRAGAAKKEKEDPVVPVKKGPTSSKMWLQAKWIADPEDTKNKWCDKKIKDAIAEHMSTDSEKKKVGKTKALAECKFFYETYCTPKGTGSKSTAAKDLAGRIRKAWEEEKGENHESEHEEEEPKEEEPKEVKKKAAKKPAKKAPKEESEEEEDD